MLELSFEGGGRGGRGILRLIYLNGDNFRFCGRGAYIGLVWGSRIVWCTHVIMTCFVNGFDSDSDIERWQDSHEGSTYVLV
jgi:hypothetical protein